MENCVQFAFCHNTPEDQLYRLILIHNFDYDIYTSIFSGDSLCFISQLFSGGYRVFLIEQTVEDPELKSRPRQYS